VLKQRSFVIAGAFLTVTLALIAFQNCGAPQSNYRKGMLLNQSQASSDTGTPRYFITLGELKTTAAGATAALNIGGRMVMVRDSSAGQTSVSVYATGLPASTSNMTHVHDMPCSVSDGGIHYKMDPTVTAVDQTNEIWPTITSSADGSGMGAAQVAQFARSDAQTMVIHDSTSTRIACGALHSPSGVSQMGGLFVPFAGGPALTGSATLIRSGGDGISVVRLSVNGLTPNTAYPAHIHSSPCATNQGGVHYKQNNAVTEVTPSAANEIWPMFTTNATGHGEAHLQVLHVARADALSIVIHDPAVMTTRLACVDLSIASGFVATEAGLTRGMNVFGTASLVRSAYGKTTVTASVTGLQPNKMYMAHVHDRRCHINAGGAHYKIDPSVATAVESNELWLHITTDAAGSGSASVTVDHIARAEAFSVVVHDTDAPTNTRLACADLY
jgi:hypothetical protein